jgi:hypothetical protein
MKRWAVKFDGADAGHVYADTVDDARRVARASYMRIHPDRDPAGRVRVDANGERVKSAAGEARQLVAQVYEGLRLLPGMEVPAEKLRNVVLLLETVAAREGLKKTTARHAGAGGDTELIEALRPVLDSQCVPATVQEEVRGLAEWVGINTPEDERQRIELKLFQALWEAKLVDLRFSEKPPCDLYKASAYLTQRLAQIGVLRIERFPDATNVDEFRAALAPYGGDAATLSWSFCPDVSGPEPGKVLRPLVYVGDRPLQQAVLMRGVKHGGEDVAAFDGALFDLAHRLELWAAGIGAWSTPLLSPKQRQLLERTEKRVHSVRQTMAKNAQEGGKVLPAETARRDLIKFLVDQVHRIADALIFLPDKGPRDAFLEQVFQDVVFRGAGAYLSKAFGIDIDTDVVSGADTQGLVGRFKEEPKGPRPRSKTSKIHSVVVPCYSQEGVSVRSASVRLGVYD